MVEATSPRYEQTYVYVLTLSPWALYCQPPCYSCLGIDGLNRGGVLQHRVVVNCRRVALFLPITLPYLPLRVQIGKDGRGGLG